MPATCPACSWPAPTLVSTHGAIRYLRCVCGKWLIENREHLLAVAGESCFADPDVPVAQRNSTST